jgi:hypothetical protein
MDIIHKTQAWKGLCFVHFTKIYACIGGKNGLSSHLWRKVVRNPMIVV